MDPQPWTTSLEFPIFLTLCLHSVPRKTWYTMWKSAATDFRGFGYITEGGFRVRLRNHDSFFVTDWFQNQMLRIKTLQVMNYQPSLWYEFGTTYPVTSYGGLWAASTFKNFKVGERAWPAVHMQIEDWQKLLGPCPHFLVACHATEELWIRTKHPWLLQIFRRSSLAASAAELTTSIFTFDTQAQPPPFYFPPFLNPNLSFSTVVYVVVDSSWPLPLVITLVM